MRLFYLLLLLLLDRMFSYFVFLQGGWEGAYLKGTLFKYFLTQGEGSHFNGVQLFEGGR